MSVKERTARVQLRELLGDVDVLEFRGNADVDVVALTHDSHAVTPGACFACVVGATTDGHDHAQAAIEAGAVALLVERPLDLDVAQARVADVRAALGPAAARLHGHPSRAMRCLGVTGTNGKTTTIHLLEAIARSAGDRVGVIGTVGAYCDGEAEPLAHTTPEATDLQALLGRMRDNGVQTVAMEVSSHALSQRRVDGTWFAVVGFTNLSHDHLDYHGDLEAYFEAKANLFDPSRTSVAVTNVDDAHGAEIADRARARGLAVTTFGLDRTDADVRAKDLELDANGARFTLLVPALDVELPITIRLLGHANVINAVAAAAMALASGYEADAVAHGLAACVEVPGRLQAVDVGQPFTVLVDYAHTPAALASALATARGLAAGRRVVVVFGCGGDRDRAKRPLMGRVAASGANHVLITTDNPRSESPATIAEEVRRGAEAEPTSAMVDVELDRRAAIRRALASAGAGDVVLIAGKGHETGQTTGSVTVPFDDRRVAREELGAPGIMLSAAEIAAATGGEIIAGAADARATSYTIDSRALHRGACFVALEAVRDGHDFVGDAFERGASIAIVERRVERLPPEATLVRVTDPMQALGALGAVARGRLAAAVVVGVTGSAGKTVTKDLVAGAIGGTRRVHASHASFNNEAGVPLTLLEAPADTEVVVTEMGARFRGNIADLAEIARPQVGVVTHVGLAHAEHLGDREQIARVKGELLESLPRDGLAVLNLACDACAGMAARTEASVLTVGRSADADVFVTAVELDAELRPRFVLESPWGRVAVRLTVRGEHQVDNAAMAAAVALWIGVGIDDVAVGLAGVRTAALRMELTRTSQGLVVINDTYNSSPTSAAAAVRSLARVPVTGRRIAVLGEMRELGAHADAAHAALGALVASLGVDVLIAVGNVASPIATGAAGWGVSVVTVTDAEAAAATVVAWAEPGDAVLVKASRAIGLERVAFALLGSNREERATEERARRDRAP